jgi:hypothetical protein
MSSIQLATIVVGGSIEPWVALGFALDQHGRVP